MSKRNYEEMVSQSTQVFNYIAIRVNETSIPLLYSYGEPVEFTLKFHNQEVQGNGEFLLTGIMEDGGLLNVEEKDFEDEDYL